MSQEAPEATLAGRLLIISEKTFGVNGPESFFHSKNGVEMFIMKFSYPKVFMRNLRIVQSSGMKQNDVRNGKTARLQKNLSLLCLMMPKSL
jgi:hypothetical protein